MRQLADMPESLAEGCRMRVDLQQGAATFERRGWTLILFCGEQPLWYLAPTAGSPQDGTSESGRWEPADLPALLRRLRGKA